MHPASVQPVEAAAARLLASPILQEYDAFHRLLTMTVDIQFIPAREISRVMQALVELIMERFATDSLG